MTLLDTLIAFILFSSPMEQAKYGGGGGSTRLRHRNSLSYSLSSGGSSNNGGGSFNQNRRVTPVVPTTPDIDFDDIYTDKVCSVRFILV